MSQLSAKYIWMDGKMIPWASANVHVMAHGLHYGSSVFEGIRAYATEQGPVIFRLRDHIQRLFASARIHRIEMPWSMEAVEAACRGLVQANDLASAYIRPVVFRGMGSLSVKGHGCPIHMAIAAFKWGAYLGEEGLEKGVDVGVASWARAAPNTFPAMAKAGGNYLNSQLIAREAERHGYDEGIALDHQGQVSEGSGENLFLVQGGRLHTPPTGCAILPGLTRDTIIRLAKKEGIEVREERLPREALYIADELFFTGTAAEVTPIRSVDGLQIGEGRRGPITAALQSAFFGLFDGRTEDEWGWLDPVATKPAVRLTA